MLVAVVPVRHDRAEPTARPHGQPVSPGHAWSTAALTLLEAALHASQARRHACFVVDDSLTRPPCWPTSRAVGAPPCKALGIARASTATVTTPGRSVTDPRRSAATLAIHSLSGICRHGNALGGRVMDTAARSHSGRLLPTSASADATKACRRPAGGPACRHRADEASMPCAPIPRAQPARRRRHCRRLADDDEPAASTRAMRRDRGRRWPSRDGSKRARRSTTVH